VKKGGFKGIFRELWLDAGERELIEIRLEPLTDPTPAAKTGKESSPRPGDVLTLSLRPGVEMKFVWIPPDEFQMGSDNKNDWEKPVHRVTLTKGFYMGVFTVTQSQWRAVMNDNPSHFRGDDRPVEKVSWDDCQEFCQKMRQLTGKSIRLPTEAEWEYACRAGTTTDYNGDGEEALRKVGWYNGNSDKQTHPVGKLAPNVWGLYDMHGNVYQWCEDWYGPYSKDDKTDPKGANFGGSRVLRGGSWGTLPGYCRSAPRDWSAPARRYIRCGCRVCFLLD
jgi:formylglycine-generating enzyme required for sulfatase activity